MSTELFSEWQDIFKQDPGNLVQYVYKEVNVTTINGRSHSGWVYTVDPVSLSIVLVQFADQQLAQIDVIMGHSIRDVIVLNDNVDTHKDRLNSLFNSTVSQDFSSAELTARREKVSSWLIRNRIPVQTCCDQPDLLSIGDVLFIHPPYLIDNCQSSNEIVLSRIQGLLRNMQDSVVDENK